LKTEILSDFYSLMQSVLLNTSQEIPCLTSPRNQYSIYSLLYDFLASGQTIWTFSGCYYKKKRNKNV